MRLVVLVKLDRQGRKELRGMQVLKGLKAYKDQKVLLVHQEQLDRQE